MALDGAFLYALRQELSCLTGSRIEKIYQPSKEEIVISLRGTEGSKKLCISANPDNARVHITERPADNPQTPPMFCMLLRKRLGHGRLSGIRQDGLERIIFFDFETVNEMGDSVILTLICEIMGRFSNITLADGNNIIIDSIKRGSMSWSRNIVSGAEYIPPPRDDRLNFLVAGRDEISEKLKKFEGAELSKALVKTFEGISPLLAREWEFRAGGLGVRADSIPEKVFDGLIGAIDESRNILINGNCCFTAVSNLQGQLKDFSFTDILQYGELMNITHFDSASELLDFFYEERDRSARVKQRANDLFKMLVNMTERVSRRINIQRGELADCSEKEQYRLFGDLISANIYRLKKGDKVLKAENFYEENSPEITIKLDTSKTPSQNAQHYYSKYKKCVTAEKVLREQIDRGQEELQYLDSVFDSLTRAVSENDIIQLRLELCQQGYLRNTGVKTRPPKPLPPMEYRSSDGFLILVGRNNVQNDRLSLKIAEKHDIWLHTQTITGSHVIIVTEGKVPPDRTIEQAAVIAAVNSKGRDSDMVAVDYCNAGYVRKPSGAKPGKVIFTNYKTAFVRPDRELAENLKL